MTEPELNSLGTEEEGFWNTDPDVLHIQNVLRKHGIDHSCKTIYDTWGDLCEKIYFASWLDAKGYPDSTLFAMYFCFSQGLYACWEAEDILIDAVDRIMSVAGQKKSSQFIDKEKFYAEIDTEQKANRANIPESQYAIGYHNGLTMAKFIALRLSAKAPEPTPTAHWEFGEPGIFGAEYVRCTNCEWKSDHVDPFLWENHPGHKFCGACGAKMDRN